MITITTEYPPAYLDVYDGIDGDRFTGFPGEPTVLPRTCRTAWVINTYGRWLGTVVVEELKGNEWVNHVAMCSHDLTPNNFRIEGDAGTYRLIVISGGRVSVPGATHPRIVWEAV